MKAVLVFTDQFIADMHRRFAAKPATHREDIYFVATSSERSGLRQWIEQAVARVPEPGRTKLISRLQADEHFINTLNELAVGSVLQSVGGEVLYEHEVEGMTPDWYVTGGDNNAPLVVAVWNKNHAQGSASRRRLWLGLQRRVRQIPAGVVRHVIAVGRKGPPSADVAKKVGSELRGWLLGGDAGVGSQREFDGYRFRVAARTATSDGPAEMTLPGEGGAFTTVEAREAIATKVRRYEQVVASRGEAFVVVVGHEVGTPISRDAMRDLVAGRQGFEVAFDPLLDGEFLDVTLPMNVVDVPISLSAAVSSVGWVEVVLADSADDSPAVSLDLWPNPARRIDTPSIPGSTLHA